MCFCYIEVIDPDLPRCLVKMLYISTSNSVFFLDPGSGATMKTRAGTPYYVSPQVLAGAYDEKCAAWRMFGADVWGCNSWTPTTSTDSG